MLGRGIGRAVRRSTDTRQGAIEAGKDSTEAESEMFGGDSGAVSGVGKQSMNLNLRMKRSLPLPHIFAPNFALHLLRIEHEHLELPTPSKTLFSKT